MHTWVVDAIVDCSFVYSSDAFLLNPVAIGREPLHVRAKVKLGWQDHFPCISIAGVIL